MENYVTWSCGIKLFIAKLACLVRSDRSPGRKSTEVGSLFVEDVTGAASGLADSGLGLGFRLHYTYFRQLLNIKFDMSISL